MLRRILLASVGAIALTGSAAFAADLPYRGPPPVYLPPPPVFSWTGLYIGGDVGGAWAQQNVFSAGCPTCFQAPETGSLGGSSVIGGGYVGYNWELLPPVVLGVEGDFSGTGINASTNAPNLFPSGFPVGSGGINWTRDVDWLASVRGRLGAAVTPNILAYATGGVAWNRTGYSAINAFSGGCPNCGTISFDNTHAGFAVGAGAEWAPWSNNWVFRVEYLFYHFSGTTATANFQPPFTGLASTFTWGELLVHSVRAGVSYKFDWLNPAPVVAKY